jgi:hypothetical protein
LKNATSPSETGFVPILRAAAIDATNNWVPVNTFSPAKVTFNGTETDQAIVISFRVERSVLARAFVIFLFSTNWVFALSVFYITVLAYMSDRAKIGEGIMTLPLTVIVAVPALRALFVGNPPFGKHCFGSY